MTVGKIALRRMVECVERVFCVPLHNGGAAFFIDGVMSRVRGSRRDPRKDEILVKILVEINQAKYSTSPKGEEETTLWLWASSDEYSDGGSGELNGEDLARFHGLVLPWSRGFGDRGTLLSFGIFGPHYRTVELAPTSHLLERLVNQRSAMSKRLKLSDLAKVVAQKAATSASKGIVISEGSETSGKRPLDDGSKGKQVAQSPEPKKARTDTGVSGAPAKPPVASGAGSSAHRTLGEALGPQASVMASAATAEKNSGWGDTPGRQGEGGHLRVFLSPYANRAIELEGALAEEQAKGKKLAEDADARSKVVAKLEARISELEKSQSLTQGRIIAAFKESDDFLEAVRGSASSYFGDGFDFCKRQLAHQYPDLGVDLEDVEMDHEFLTKEEADAEQRAAEEGAAGAEGCCSVFILHLAINRSAVPCMFTKTNLGGEESEQSLPSWISDHLGAKSYIDETSQSPSSPPPNSPKMDTSSLTKEGNVMTQAELDKLGSTYSFPSGIRLRIPGDGETILSARQGEVAFYEAAFQAGLRLPLHPTIREILIHYKICPAQLSPNAWRSVICSLVIWRHFKRHMSCDEFRCLYSLSPLPDSGWYYFKARPDKNLLRESLSNVKGWKTRFFFASEDEWEFPSGTAASNTLRVPRSWGTPGKSCNKLPTLSEVDAKRTEEVLEKIEPGGYFEVSKVLGSRTFQKHFAAGCTALSASGRDNTASGEEGEFITREDSVEYLGVIRRDIGGVIRRAHPGIPDETLLRWLGGKVKDPFTNILSGTSGSSSDSGSVSTSDSELPPELRSDAMSARGKAKAEKATKTTAKPPTKGVVIREKRTREGDPLIEIGEPDASKGKEAVPPPAPKRFKSNRGAINARGRAAGAGTSSHGGDVGSESMSDASVARKLLTWVIPAFDKEEVDRLSENELVAKSFHALGQVVVFASSLALRSQENLHEIDFQMARADSAELELVKTQNRALKAENKLAELSEEGSKPGNEVDDLKATVAELTNKLAKAKELAIEDFKASGEFKAAVTDSAATYFSEGFEFCKRQLLH
ncbi:hypothetical protein Acr_00g0060040 [Actinidia rufa]|uniref:Transposase (putative) gypsy type domain-containing protein n=2 Tax=Actinidia rufa TaxID=165716 RepID=A0A7J0DN95_9ERIC|nr:hypothetical protein Acr_00g0060040 [Actinidia rufa]